MKLQPIINDSTQVKDPEIKIYKVDSDLHISLKVTEIWQYLDRLKEYKSDQTFMSPASIKAWANTPLSVSSLHDARPTVDSENDNQRSYAKPVKTSLNVLPQ